MPSRGKVLIIRDGISFGSSSVITDTDRLLKEDLALLGETVFQLARDNIVANGGFVATSGGTPQFKDMTREQLRIGLEQTSQAILSKSNLILSVPGGTEGGGGTGGFGGTGMPPLGGPFGNTT